MHVFINGTINGDLVVYHRRGLCNKKESKTPWAEGILEERLDLTNTKANTSDFKVMEGVP